VAVRSRVRIPPTAAVYQRQLSMPSLRGRLMSTSESRGVTDIPRDALISPYPSSYGFGWCQAEGYETEISAAPWALRFGKRTLLFLLYICYVRSYQNHFIFFEN